MGHRVRGEGGWRRLGGKKSRSRVSSVRGRRRLGEAQAEQGYRRLPEIHEPRVRRWAGTWLGGWSPPRGVAAPGPSSAAVARVR